MQKSKINKVNEGTLFRLTESDKDPVWVRGAYNRSEGKYSCTKYEDTNHEKLMKADQAIYIGFTF